jgi:predicted RNase H-like nuclease (RuvC/YqgF family)
LGSFPIYGKSTEKNKYGEIPSMQNKALGCRWRKEKMRDNLTRIRDIALDVENGSRNIKALAYCVAELTREIEELKKRIDK